MHRLTAGAAAELDADAAADADAVLLQKSTIKMYVYCSSKFECVSEQLASSVFASKCHWGIAWLRKICAVTGAGAFSNVAVFLGESRLCNENVGSFFRLENV